MKLHTSIATVNLINLKGGDIMSTRCQIGFYATGNTNLHRPDALLYRHGDGYPDGIHGVIADLVPFLKDFHNRRGLDDWENASAWTMHHLIAKDIAETLEKRADSRYNSSYYHEDGRQFTGYGICNEFHGDIEYYYAVSYMDVATLKVYAVNSWNDDEKLPEPQFVLAKTVKLAAKSKAVTRRAPSGA